MELKGIYLVASAFFAALITNLLLPTKIDYHGPDSNIIRKEHYKKDDTCYQLKPKIIDCP